MDMATTSMDETTEKEITFSVEKGPEEKARVDEINLSEIPKKEENKQILVNDLFKIDGEYKNPNFKPWTVVEPEKDLKILWDMIKTDNLVK